MSLRTVLVCCLLSFCFVATTVAEPLPPGPYFFSPQKSPDGSLYLWESLERDGSIWMTDGDGEKLRYLGQGHSPSWETNATFRFVRSRDDGHEILEQNLYRYDVDGGMSVLLAYDSDNPDYKTVVMAAQQAAFPDRPLAGVMICLDPGHGKNSGAYSRHSEEFEDFYALQSALWIKDYLEESGATVRLTREDNSTCPALSSRVNFSNAIGARLFCSIHYNSAGNESAHGLEVFHRSWNSTSKNQAQKIHDRMKAATGLHSRGVKGDKEVLGFYLGVLSSSHKTSYRTLTEGAFLSNASDAALVDSPTWNESLSYGIYAGICDTLGVEAEAQHSVEVLPISESFAGPIARRWVGSPVETLRLDTPEGDGSAIVLSAAANACATLRTGGGLWSSYRISSILRTLGSGAGSFGVLARCGACERTQLQAFLLLVDERAGTAQLLASLGNPADSVVLASCQLGEALLEKEWHELVIDCQPNGIQASVDGVQLETVQLTSDQTNAIAAVVKYGKAGCYLHGTHGSARLVVDSFELQPNGVVND